MAGQTQPRPRERDAPKMKYTSMRTASMRHLGVLDNSDLGAYDLPTEEGGTDDLAEDSAFE